MADQVKTLNFKIVTDVKEAKAELDNYKKAVAKLKDELKQRTVGVPMKGISSLLSGIKAIGRIAVYRAIRSAIKAVTQAFSEGYNAAVEYSQLVGYELAGTVERLSTNLNTMKLTLGSLAGQTLMALEPILTWLIEKVTTLADRLANMIAYLRGQDKYLKDVTKSTKELAKAKQYLLGIDEINKWNDSTTDTSSTQDYIQVEVDIAGAKEMLKVLESLKVTAIGIGVIIGTFKVFKIIDTINNLKTAQANVASLIAFFEALSKGSTTASATVVTSSATICGSIGTVAALLAPIVGVVATIIWDINRGTISMEEFTKKSTDGLKDTASSWEIAYNALKVWFSEGMPQIIDSTTAGLGTVSSHLNSWAAQWNQRLGEMRHSWKMMWIEMTGDDEDYWDNIRWNINHFIWETKQWLNDLHEWIVDLFTIRLVASDTSVGSRAQMAIHAYANGGLPTNGELFVAREAGAELVGNIGGKTSVMNNDQIVEAVSAGVANAVSSVMNGRGGQNINLYIDGKQIKNVVTKLQSNSARAYGV